MGESGSENGADKIRQITLDTKIRREVNSEHRKWAGSVEIETMCCPTQFTATSHLSHRPRRGAGHKGCWQKKKISVGSVVFAPYSVTAIWK